MITPHINAQLGDFAKTVLMPGDPLRAKFIAENFLDDVRLINTVRNTLGYTGTYKGIPVSVMASGMGIPSIGLYSYELFTFFNVENIIRIGSAGSYVERLQVRDVVLAEYAFSNSTFALNTSGSTDKQFMPDEIDGKVFWVAQGSPQEQKIDEWMKYLWEKKKDEKKKD
jgi:purine-nucleoside phosphorylase